MTLLEIFSITFHSVVLALSVFAAVASLVSRKRGGFRDGMFLLTVLLACLCGFLVNVVNVCCGRLLSGLYAVHLSFAMSPLFLHRVCGGGRPGLVVTLVVTSSVVVWAFLSFFGGVLWNVDKWLPPLMTVVLLFLLGRNVWRLTARRGRFDAVAVCREWMLSLTDILYYAVLVLLATVGLGIGNGGSWGTAIGASLCVVLLVGLLSALWLRLRKGQSFLVFSSRENTFLGNIGRESRAAYMGNVECGMYGEGLFTALKEYFDDKMPYLKPDITLTDVAKYLVTNKVYLSRAINDFTGQNFRQFVNFYRVKYAIRLFNCNNAYKVADLAAKSGFNCERSFIMAFHLYMNTSPSRWCKQNMEKHVGKALRK